VRMREMSGG